MIYSILFVDSGGILVHSWERVELEKITDKKPFIASLIKALMDFGGEVIATPQRVDFGELAMTFFPLKTEKRDLWVTAISDPDDPKTATKECVDEITAEIKDLLLAMAPSDGFVFESKELTDYANKKIDAIVKTYRKRLEEIRTSPSKSLALGLPITMLIAFFCFWFATLLSFYLSYGNAAVQNLLFYLLLSSLGILYGYNGGILAGNQRGGALTGYFATFLTGILFLYLFSPPTATRYELMIQIPVYAYTAGFHGLAGWYGGKSIAEHRIYPPRGLGQSEGGTEEAKVDA